MKDFLNDFMGKNRNIDDKEIARYENLFKDTANTILEYLGDKPFHIRSGLNAAVFDSVMVAFARNLNNIPDDIKKRYHVLVEDSDFKNATTSGTTAPNIVHQRISTAEKILFGN